MTSLLNKNLNNELAKTQEELIKAREELAVLKAEYQEFVYIVSHDLSAPVRQIEGFSEIVSTKHSDSFDDKTKRHFNLILKGTTQIKGLLDGLISYSRINTHAESFTEIDIDSIITSIKEKLSSVIEATGATISYDNMPIVKGDKDQISLIFYHILHNALHYQVAGSSPSITIKAIKTKNHWQFCITDNGIGILENVAEKIFKVFRRGVSDKQYTGIGMGLALTKKIVGLHQGTIWFESEKGTGSSFYFTIESNIPDE